MAKKGCKVIICLNVKYNFYTLYSLFLCIHFNCLFFLSKMFFWIFPMCTWISSLRLTSPDFINVKTWGNRLLIRHISLLQILWHHKNSFDCTWARHSLNSWQNRQLTKYGFHFQCSKIISKWIWSFSHKNYLSSIIVFYKCTRRLYSDYHLNPKILPQK